MKERAKALELAREYGVPLEDVKCFWSVSGDWRVIDAACHMRSLGAPMDPLMAVLQVMLRQSGMEQFKQEYRALQEVQA